MKDPNEYTSMRLRNSTRAALEAVRDSMFRGAELGHPLPGGTDNRDRYSLEQVILALIQERTRRKERQVQSRRRKAADRRRLNGELNGEAK